MSNPAKAALLLFLLIFIVIAFFALTGINPSTPEKSAYQLADKLVQLNRAINHAMRNFFLSIRLWFQGLFSG